DLLWMAKTKKSPDQGQGSRTPPEASTQPKSGLGRGIAGFWTGLIQALPKIKTGLQLTGLLFIVAGYLAYQQVPRERVPGIIAAGGIGVLFLVFGQVFRS